MSSLVDRRLWSNLLQLIAGCISAVIGAICAYPIPPDTNWLAGVIGSVLGFIAAVLVTGAFFAFMPAAHTHRRVATFVYLRRVKQSAIAIKIYFVAIGICITAALVASAFPNRIPQQDFVYWILIVHTVPYLFAKFTQFRILDVGCPSCDHAFGIHNPFKPTEHKCENCGEPFVDSAAISSRCQLTK